MTVDQKIIEGCIEGKRRSQNQLYTKFSSGMLGVCLRYCRNLEDAEDVLQEGFIKVFRAIHTFRGESSIGSWIKRIMINTAITHNKKLISSQFESIDLLDESNFEEKDEDTAIYQPVEPETLLKCIQQLPQGYRTVLNLYVFEGYSHKEIAGLLKITENTSKTQLFKARNHLRISLEPLRNEKLLIQ
jgi:RNA polymerase sigma factor (sigma-70 family)